MRNTKVFTERLIATTERTVFRKAANDSALLSRDSLQAVIDEKIQLVSDEDKRALFEELMTTLERVSVTSNLVRMLHNGRVRLRYAADLSDKEPIEISLMDVQFESKTCTSYIVLTHCMEKIQKGELRNERALQKAILLKLCKTLEADLRKALMFAFLNTIGYRPPPPSPSK